MTSKMLGPVRKAERPGIGRLRSGAVRHGHEHCARAFDEAFEPVRVGGESPHEGHDGK